MNVAVGLMDGLGLDGDRCIRVIPRQTQQKPRVTEAQHNAEKHFSFLFRCSCNFTSFRVRVNPVSIRLNVVSTNRMNAIHVKPTVVSEPSGQPGPTHVEDPPRSLLACGGLSSRVARGLSAVDPWYFEPIIHHKHIQLPADRLCWNVSVLLL